MARNNFNRPRTVYGDIRQGEKKSGLELRAAITENKLANSFIKKA